MCKVLVIAYYFPPTGGAGVQRTLKFIKYLPEYGWQPVVLTIKKPPTHLTDRSLQDDTPKSIPIYRTPALLIPQYLPWRLRNFFRRWFLIIDEQLGWLPIAARHGLMIIKNEGIKAIYTTSSPYTDHLIGLRLKQHTGLPWVADFRDPWIGNFAVVFPTRWHAHINQKLEQQVLEKANRITVVSQPMKMALETRYPYMPYDHVHLLPNGYDPADFDGISPIDKQNDKFTIIYSGSFYGQKQTPYYFLKGLRTFIDQHKISRQDLHVRFVGNMGSAVNEQIKGFDLSDIVQLIGYIPHRQSIAHLLAADLLLLVVGSGTGSEAVLTGKIFEYLAAQKTILCLAPPGAAADLVQEAQAGVVVDPEDTEAIASRLASLYRKWKQGELKVNPKPEVIMRYNRHLLTGTLAKLLDEIS